MGTRLSTKHKYQLAKLALIAVLLNALLFVGFVPASMAAGSSEFRELGLLINNKSSDQIYANRNMQARVTVFWTWNDLVEDKSIESIRLLDRYTKQDIDSKGWNYKKTNGDYTPENDYLHEVLRSSESSISSLDNGLLQGRSQDEDDDFRDLFVSYEEENVSDTVNFCVELESSSGYVESTCDGGTANSVVTLVTLSPVIYRSDKWLLSIHDESSHGRNDYDTKFTFIDLVNKDERYPGTQGLDSSKAHVSKHDGLNYQVDEGLLFDNRCDAPKFSCQTERMVWPVMPNQDALEVVGFHNNDEFSKYTLTAPNKPDVGPLAYRFLQIDNYSEGYDSGSCLEPGNSCWTRFYASLSSTKEQRLVLRTQDVYDTFRAWDNDGKETADFWVDGNLHTYSGQSRDILNFRDRYGTAQSVAFKLSLRGKEYGDFFEIAD